MTQPNEYERVVESIYTALGKQHFEDAGFYAVSGTNMLEAEITYHTARPQPIPETTTLFAETDTDLGKRLTKHFGELEKRVLEE